MKPKRTASFAAGGSASPLSLPLSPLLGHSSLVQRSNSGANLHQAPLLAPPGLGLGLGLSEASLRAQPQPLAPGDEPRAADLRLLVKNKWIAVSFWLCGGRQRDRIVISVLLVLFAGLVVSLIASFSIVQVQPTNPPHPSAKNNVTLDPIDHAMLTLNTGFPYYTPNKVPVFSASWQADRRYGIVIDAGSSGSRLLVYSWKVFDHPSQIESQIYPRIERAVPRDSGKPWSKAIQPGLSSLYSKLNSSSISKESVGLYLDPLLKFASTIIPSSLHSSTPIYLLATAGMRLVPQMQRDLILQYACAFVSENYNFDVLQGEKGCSTQFRVISGEAEGVFGWVTINYLNNGFSSRELQKPPPPTPISPSTFGFLDMGGASTQIAFEPIESMKLEHGDDLTEVVLRSLNGDDIVHRVFVSTFLGFGVNEARRRYVEGLALKAGLRVNAAMLRRGEPEGNTIIDAGLEGGDSSSAPSLLSSSKPAKIVPHIEGASPTVPLASPPPLPPPLPIVNSILPTNAPETTTSTMDFTPLYDTCLPKGLLLDSNNYLSRVVSPLSNPMAPPILIGSGSLLDCLTELNPYLNTHLPCPSTPCLFNGVHAPIANFSLHRFLGISEYYHTPHAVPGAVSNKGVYQFGEFVKSADKICKSGWSDLVQKEKEKEGLAGTGKNLTELEESRLQLLCFKSAWVLGVLHEGFGIPRNDLVSDDEASGSGIESGPMIDDIGSGSGPFEPANELDGFPISWTMGAMLFHVSSTIQPRQRVTADGSFKNWFATKYLWVRLFLGGLCIIVTGLLGVIFWRRYKRVKASVYRRRGSRATVPHLTSFWPNPMEEEILLGQLESGVDNERV